MRKLYLDVQVRDSLGKLYKNKDGNNVAKLAQLQCSDYGDDITQLTCENISKNFEAVCKEGSQIYIDVMYHDSISDTYPIIYSFYGAENKFVKH